MLIIGGLAKMQGAMQDRSLIIIRSQLINVACQAAASKLEVLHRLEQREAWTDRGDSFESGESSTAWRQ